MIFTPPSASRRRVRGVGLLDALIAMVILSFGILGLTRMQTRLISQTTEAQERLTAVQLGDELVSMVLIDAPPNKGCYTLPNPGACANAAAVTEASKWKTRLGDALTDATATARIDANRYTLTIKWTGKSTGEERTMQVTTDAR